MGRCLPPDDRLFPGLRNWRVEIIDWGKLSRRSLISKL
jgi:hypothetical protein